MGQFRDPEGDAGHLDVLLIMSKEFLAATRLRGPCVLGAGVPAIVLIVQGTAIG